MYSKAETQKIKQEFWIAFAERYPHKWLLYDTKIKDFAFKFYVDNKKAQVLIDIEHKDKAKRMAYFAKLESLNNILEDEFISGLIFYRDYVLDTGKAISRIQIEISGVSINNTSDWEKIFAFFKEKMAALEMFYFEYDDYIKDI